MSTPRPRVYVYQRRLPLWLVVAMIAPLGLVFLTSLLVALGLAAIVALIAGTIPFLRRPMHPRDGETIELAPSQYRRLKSTPGRDE
jgi:hypothetical protein